MHRAGLALGILFCGLCCACSDETTDGDDGDCRVEDCPADASGDASGDGGADTANEDVSPACQVAACPDPAICDESSGTARCVCPAGFNDTFGDGRSCVDIDECAGAPCGGAGLCMNTPGSFSCDCEVGDIWDGGDCRSVSERRLAVGDRLVCHLDGSETLFCWGGNRTGALGNGTQERRAQPEEVLGDHAFITVAAAGLAGDSRTCAIRDDSSLWCWGRDAAGFTMTLEPNQYVPETGWTAIDVGATHGCGVREGALYCWGSNAYGQMGILDVASAGLPTHVGEATNWTQVSLGDAHSCALRDDHTLWCWGINQVGEVGDGTEERRDEPVQVGEDADWAILEAGAVNTCGIRTDGSLWCWGSNTIGQLGLGQVTAQESEPARLGSDDQWRAIDMGGGYACAIRSTGDLWCWGNVIGTQSHSHLTPDRVGTQNDWVEVSVFSTGLAAGGTACGERHDGSVWCWGLNDNGELGQGFFGDKGAPDDPIDEETYRFVEARSFRTYAIRDDGTLWGWGGVVQNTGLTDPTQVPIQLSTDTDWEMMVAGEGYQCAIRTGGTLWCWGYAFDGELGLGEDNDYVTEPTQLGGGPWQSVVLGGDLTDARTCALGTDQTLWCWGEGPLGNGGYDTSYVPVQVGTDEDWLQVSAGERICGLREPGTLWCWGDPGVEFPTQIGEDADWTLIHSGLGRSYGIRSPGTLWEIVDDNEDPPVQIGVEDDWLYAEELLYLSCGLRDPGTLWCWGTDFEAMVQGTGGTVVNPTQIGTADDWESVSTGGIHACAMNQSGRVSCWGEGLYGRLGDGEAWRVDPVEVIFP